MASTEARRLAPADAGALTRLSAEAGWNQTADDWRLILRHGAGEASSRPTGARSPAPATCR
jgi:hypothetical protein